MNSNSKLDGNKALQGAVFEMDSQLPDQVIALPIRPWPEIGYTALPHLKSGAVLGGLAGCTSLLMNIVGSVFWPAVSGVDQHPLRIIQVYLTLPLGGSALQLNTGAVLAFGCLLYVFTGMLYGMLFEFLVSYFLPHATGRVRFALFMLMSISIWAINFYGILIWLQPVVTGGRWIIDLIPWWVAVVTHLVFGWTMALIYSLGVEGSQKRTPEKRLAAGI